MRGFCQQVAQGGALILTLIGGQAIALEQSDVEEDLESVCQKTTCRAPGTVRVKHAGGGVEFKHKGLPYVHSDRVVVLLGESFDVQVVLEKGKSATLSYGSATTPTAKSLHVEFEQSDATGGVMLTLSSKLGSLVKYDAYMFIPGRGLVYTSSCPLMAQFGTESWPDPIPELVLTNFREIEASGASLSCN